MCFRLAVLDAVRVVVLETGGAVAALSDAHRLLPEQRDLLRDVGPAAEVRHVLHVDALGDDELDDRFAQHLASRLHRDRTKPGDLAGLVALRASSYKRFEIDAQHREVADRGLRRRRAARLVGQRHQRVVQVRLEWLARAVDARLLEDLVDDRLECLIDARHRRLRAGGVKMLDALLVAIAAQTAVLVDALLDRLQVLAFGLGLGALVAQSAQRARGGDAEQLVFRSGVHRERIGDRGGLVGRELARDRLGTGTWVRAKTLAGLDLLLRLRARRARCLGHELSCIDRARGRWGTTLGHSCGRHRQCRLGGVHDRRPRARCFDRHVAIQAACVKALRRGDNERA